MRTIVSRYFSTSKNLIELEKQYGCNNYAPLPVVVDRAQGVYMYDCEGKKYLDFLSAYSAVNQGHCHPKIYKAFVNQAQQMTLTSRAVYNSKLGVLQKKLNEVFGYDKALLMNSGVQAGQSAVKFARRWGYEVKKVPKDSATVLFANGNFWGRSIAACASSDDPERYTNFGPFQGLRFQLIDYGDINALETALKNNPNIVAYMVEPIQGEKGVVVPPAGNLQFLFLGYLKQAKQLLKKHNSLLICDEIQTGLGRTGKLLCSQHDDVRPDITLLGKALSGGFYPVSAVLCDNHIMDTIRPGDHGSTYGGNPLGATTAMAALDVVLEEKLSENSEKLGEVFKKNLSQILSGQHVKQIRGKGLFVGVQFHSDRFAYEFSSKMLENGLVAKPTQKNIIRFSPPLVINASQIEDATKIVESSWKSLL